MNDIPADCQLYRFGDAVLSLRADDRSFVERFDVLFGGCATERYSGDLPVISAVLLAHAESACVQLSVRGGSGGNAAEFTEAVFRDDGIRRAGQDGDWIAFTGGNGSVWRMAVRGDEMVLENQAPWPYLVGATLVHRTMSAQSNVLFVHAAAVDIDGAGVLLVGPTGSGKTTLSLGLAGRGSRFFSDEIGAIRFGEASLLPFPRAVGVRSGPRASVAESLLAGRRLPVERFADGSHKSLLPASSIDTAPLESTVPLEHIVVLAGRGARAEWTDLDSAPGNSTYINPVKSTPYSVSSGLKTLGLIGLTAGVKWHQLIAADPDATVTLIERRIREG